MTPYPLAWPDTLPRTDPSRREVGRFKATLSTALANAKQSLTLFGKDSSRPVADVVFSSNVGGLDQSAVPKDPGVALWFRWDDQQRCIAVDRYTTPAANLQAIHHILEADRTKLRHGSLEIVRASYKGFVALPAPGKRHWREVLGFVTTNLAVIRHGDIEARYRALARERHPDAGGSREAWDELERAKAEALQAVAERAL